MIFNENATKICAGAKNKKIVRDAFLKLNHEVRELGVAKKAT